MATAVAFRPDAYQANLFAVDEPHVDALPRRGADLARRTRRGSTWSRGWLGGADLVFADLVETVPVAATEGDDVRTAGSTSGFTRLVGTGEERPEPLSILATARHVLSEHYDRPFDSIGFNLYRDGRDSVGIAQRPRALPSRGPDRGDRQLGVRRVAFNMRPRSATPESGPVAPFLLGHGDLFVMGGACQHD